VKRDLERIAIPGEHEARERAWRVAEAAFVEREGVERRPRRWRIALSIGVATAAVLAVVSPPGRAVLDDIRAVVGVERAEPALFSLPAKGRLLVASDAGIWVVQHDGSKRLLGRYREASWSPFGRFVVVARENELAALEPDGNIRWTLARRNVSSPRWTGTAADTRIAYVDRTGIRVVAGDGTGDRLLVRAGGGPLAWRPGPRFVLAYSAPGGVRVVDATSGRMLWSVRLPRGSATGIEWSADGRRLLVLSPYHLRLYDDRGRLVRQDDPSEGWPDAAAIFRPHTREATVARLHGSQSSAYLLSGPTLFNGTGAFDRLAWSPDGRWLVVGWPTADQWVFVRAGGARRIQAVSNLSEQFRSRSLPRIEGWSR
jgi:hypothetical protein